MDQKFKKIVLAYSGGLDTSVMISWLKENYDNCEVIAVVGNVGQGDNELEGIEEKAIKTGASKIYVEDLKEELVNDFIVPTIKAGAKYENEYLLGTPFSRPLIGKKLVEIALKEGADAICHGCTGKGNDQVRFELAIKNFAPDMPVIVPWRTWELKSREDEIEYAKKHNIPLKINKETNYSKDKNIWHLSHEGLDLESIKNEPKYDKILEMGVSPQNAPDKEEYLELEFEKGIPSKLNGKEMSVLEIIEALNEIGGKNGIGIIDLVEERLVGMKSRGVYETPGGTIIYKAHEWLESVCLDKDMQEDKEAIFDAIDTVKNCLSILSPMIDTMTVLKDNMKKAAGKGFINATDCADYLVEKGLAFRDAYKITGSLVGYAIDTDNTLESLSIEEYKKYSDLFEKDIYEKIDLINYLKSRNVPGGPAPKAVKKQIQIIKNLK